MSKSNVNSPYKSGTLPLVVVNPHSASRSTERNWPSIASDLRTHFGPYSVEFTKFPGHASEIARRAAEKGCALVIACGGDGTINEVADGILQSGTDAELAIFPSGTGGDFRRSIGMPDSNREAASAIRKGETKRIDVGKVTFKTLEGASATRYFLNVSSFGLAAAIIERLRSSNKLDWLPLSSVRGRASYALSTLQEVIDVEPLHARIKVDGKEERILSTVNFSIANARYFGGGMMIAPDAKLDDGLFDIVNVGDIKTAKIILNGYTLYLGSHLRLPEVKATRAKRIEARPANDADIIPIEVDGELPGYLPAIYEIIPQRLRLRIPKQDR